MSAREIPEGWVRVNVPGSGEAAWCAALERYGVQVQYIDQPSRRSGVVVAVDTMAYAPEWALLIMQSTRPVQGGMRRRAVTMCLANEKVARAVRAAHRLGGDPAVWAVLCSHLYGLDSVGALGELRAVPDSLARDAAWDEESAEQAEQVRREIAALHGTLGQDGIR